MLNKGKCPSFASLERKKELLTCTSDKKSNSKTKKMQVVKT